MKGDDVGLLPRQPAQRAVTKGHVTMGGSMKTVAADAVPPVEVVGDGVQVSLLRNRVVKRSIEHSHLGNIFAKKLARRNDALNVLGIMKRSKLNAVFNPLQDLAVDQRRLREHLAAVHNAMPNGVNVSRTLDLSNTRFVRRNVADHIVQRRRNVAQGSSKLLLGLGAL